MAKSYAYAVERVAELRALQHKREMLANDKTNDRAVVNALLTKLDAEIRNIEADLADCENRPMLSRSGTGGDGGGSVRTQGAYELRGPTASKRYRDMFGSDGGFTWTDRATDFWAALFSGRSHPELVQRSMTTFGPSDGGFLVPVQYVEQIFDTALEDEVVRPRCYILPMQSNQAKLPALEIGNHNTALFGGFVASWKEELGTLSEANPKARGMTLDCKKLTALIRYSAELQQDIPGGGFQQVVDLCAKGLSHYLDVAFLSGTGSGQPLGVLNSAALVVQPKESGQSNGTVLYENIVGMISKLFPGSFRRAVWVVHPSCVPQLLSLSIAIGTGGAPVPMVMESGGGFSLMTRPLLISEKMQTLGTQGDIGLFDFSQYVVGLRGELRVDTSIHVAFQTDELLTRLIARVDGQPLWDKALTLADGTTKVSPFVALAAR